MIFFAIITGISWAAAIVGWSLVVAGQKVHDAQMSSYKKVGTWYEKRVAELENENRQLASQVVETLGRPAVAMPLMDPDPGYEYASDPTGIVVERLDPRDLPFGQVG